MVCKHDKSSFPEKLATYATAAGLGAFSYAQDANAAIVFVDVPDTTITVGDPSIYIYLDGDATNELAINAFQIGGGPNTNITFTPFNPDSEQNAFLSGPGGGAGYYVFSFAPGAEIGPGSIVSTGYGVAGGRRNFGYYFYNFIGEGNYVGFRWDIGGGDFSYGWLEVDVTGQSATGADQGPNAGTVTLKSYAYESTPNTAIAAGVIPEPSSLALLAAGGGAVALASRRRKLHEQTPETAD